MRTSQSMIEIRNSSALQRLSHDGMITVGGEVIAVIEADSLIGVNLRQRTLDHADFQRADLHGADFTRANLLGAHFEDADLSEANFEGAHLWLGDFRGACLRETNLTNASLVGARLQGVDLRRANLHNTELRFACYDETTQWPNDVDPQARGAKLPSQTRSWNL